MKSGKRPRVCLVALLVSAGAGSVTLKVSVDGDTFLPYELVCMRVVVGNTGSLPETVPQICPGFLPNLFDIYLKSEVFGSTESISCSGYRSHGDTPRGADWGWRGWTVLAPGESIMSDWYNISDHGWRDESVAEGGARIPPGTYTLIARWRGGFYPKKSGSWLDASPEPAVFVVGKPAGKEARAMELLGKTLHHHGLDDWRRPGCEGERAVARRYAFQLLSKFPDIGDYAPQALQMLSVSYNRQSYITTGASVAARSAWADSAVAIYVRMFERYPNATGTGYRLLWGENLEKLKSKARFRAFLEGLTVRFPGTRAAREAARLLANAGASGKE